MHEKKASSLKGHVKGFVRGCGLHELIVLCQTCVISCGFLYWRRGVALASFSISVSCRPRLSPTCFSIKLAQSAVALGGRGGVQADRVPGRWREASTVLGKRLGGSVGSLCTCRGRSAANGKLTECHRQADVCVGVYVCA